MCRHFSFEVYIAHDGPITESIGRDVLPCAFCYWLLQHTIEDIYKSLTNLSQEEKITKLLMLKLRYFTPKEIANLLGFPSEFGFPEKITVKQRYRLLGNSLNVHVVAKLIKILYE